MSYFVVSESGKGADFATNTGLRKLRELGIPSLNQFLDNGEADEPLRQRLVKDLAGHPRAGYIAKMFKNLQAPITLSNGT